MSTVVSLFVYFLWVYCASGSLIAAQQFTTIPCMVAYYPFNGDANDLSGHGNHGAVTGAALTLDRFGNSDSSYYFNGLNNYIEVQQSNTLNNFTQLTVTFWMQANSWPVIGGLGSPGVVDKKLNDFDYGFTIYNPSCCGQTGKLSWGIYFPSYISSTTNVDVGLWEHWAIVQNSKEVNLYKNGNLENTVSNVTTIISSTANLFIGHTQTWNGWYNGALDEIRIFNNSLTQDQVNTVMNCEVTNCFFPLAPTITTAAAGSVNTGTATVSFVAGSDQGSAITHCQAQTNPCCGSGSTSGPGVSPIIVTGLTQGIAYTFTVTCSNSLGTSPSSAPSISVTPIGTPLPPSIGIVEAIGESSVTVAFTPSSNNGGAVVFQCTASSTPGSITGTSFGSSPISVTGLTAGIAYTFTVHCTNSVGDSEKSILSLSVGTFGTSPPIIIIIETSVDIVNLTLVLTQFVASLANVLDIPSFRITLLDFNVDVSLSQNNILATWAKARVTFEIQSSSLYTDPTPLDVFTDLSNQFSNSSSPLLNSPNLGVIDNSMPLHAEQTCSDGSTVSVFSTCGGSSSLKSFDVSVGVGFGLSLVILAAISWYLQKAFKRRKVINSTPISTIEKSQENGDPRHQLVENQEEGQRHSFVESATFSTQKATVGEDIFHLVNNESEKKQQFIRYIFHEVRVPMNAILLGLSELQRALGSTAKESDLVTILIQQGEIICRILNDSLNLTKIEQGALRLEFIPFIVRDLILDVIGGFQSAATAKNVKLVLEMKTREPPLEVVGDKYRLRQVLSNLVSNAIKFSFAGTSVIVKFQILEVGESSFNNIETTTQVTPPSDNLNRRIHPSNDEEYVKIRFSVIDEGVGITEEHQSQLFQPYMQILPGQLQTGKGTGLGLAISKTLIESHGGTIGYLPSSSGAGSEFWIELKLPVVKTVSTSIPLESSPLHLQSPAIHLVMNQTPLSLKGRILCVEDCPVNRKLLVRILQRMNFEVVEATNGQEAVDIYRSEQKFDIILMDGNMPVKDGLQATKELRGLGCNLPIIAITGNAAPQDVSNFLCAGANHVLTKPIKEQKLSLLLSQFFRS